MLNAVQVHIDIYNWQGSLLFGSLCLGITWQVYCHSHRGTHCPVTHPPTVDLAWFVSLHFFIFKDSQNLFIFHISRVRPLSTLRTIGLFSLSLFLFLALLAHWRCHTQKDQSPGCLTHHFSLWQRQQQAKMTGGCDFVTFDPVSFPGSFFIFLCPWPEWPLSSRW